MNKPARILWSILSALICVMVAGVLFAPPHGLAKSDDPWIADDKAQHFVWGSMIAAGVAQQRRDEVAGFYAGAAVGVAKELYDYSNRKRGGVASWRDLAVTVAGAYVGARTAGFMLTANGFVFVRRF